MSHIVIETEKLYISPKSIEEMETLCNMEADPELKKAYAEMLDAMLRLNGHEEWGAVWKINLKTGVSVGGICFKGAPDAGGTVEIGYGIDEAYRRKGYATEAVGGIVKWALAQDGVRHITAQTEPDNTISQTVLLKNSFFRDGYGDEGPLYKVER
ncbi:GNAT family N-acetyltransferase [Oscillibacter sp.]|uniref:GNAT family N-acetyltransferase n=1 Tax=Oscillibacter sp. TaxID=1945593 RepID=UPI003395DC86